MASIVNSNVVLDTGLDMISARYIFINVKYLVYFDSENEWLIDIIENIKDSVNFFKESME